ncbi:MAG: rhodanese-like domain-containing protein [Bacteroidota bacterium]
MEKELYPSLFIGIDGSFAPWVGTLVRDIKQPIVLITPEGREEEVITRLARVGYDEVYGYLEGGLTAWKAAGMETDSIESISAEELAERMAAGDVGEILDVRKPSEFLSHHVLEARNFPLDYINSNMNRLDRNQSYVLHCLGGYRSMITASILRARGFRNLIDIQKGWRAIEESSIPKTEYVCPTKLSQEVIDQAVADVV